MICSSRLTSNPIFIGGDGRSGTTLVSVVLDSVPTLAVGPELHFSGPDDLGPSVERCATMLANEDPRVFGKGLKEHPELKKAVQFAKRTHRFGLDFEVLAELCREAMSITGSKLKRFEDRCQLIELIGERRRCDTGSDCWGIKIMREIGNVSRYAGVWPEARFLHVVRDGRDVAASQITEHATWGAGSVAEAAKTWTTLLKKVNSAARRFQIHQFRYEDLVLKPEPTIRTILDFLGVPWSDAVLRHAEVDHTLYRNPYNHASIDSVTKPLNDSAIGRYHRDMDASQVAEYERIAGSELAVRGYAVGLGTASEA